MPSMHSHTASLRAGLALWVGLTMATIASAADWAKVSTGESSDFYLATTQEPKAGGRLVIWALRDHHSVMDRGQGEFRSSKDQLEVDCPGRRIRRIYAADYAQSMGQGRMVSSEYGPMSWNRAEPGTIVQRIVAIACARP